MHFLDPRLSRFLWTFFIGPNNIEPNVLAIVEPFQLMQSLLIGRRHSLRNAPRQDSIPEKVEIAVAEPNNVPSIVQPVQLELKSCAETRSDTGLAPLVPPGNVFSIFDRNIWNNWTLRTLLLPVLFHSNLSLWTLSPLYWPQNLHFSVTGRAGEVTK